MSLPTNSRLFRFCVLSWLACLAVATPRVEAADPPPRTREQQEKLKERDRYVAEVTRLQREGKLGEAIAAAEKMLAIERQVFGDVHGDVAESLEWLAGMHEQREDFTDARNARREVLALRIKLQGETHWRVTDARLALADNESLARMTPQQRQRLMEAKRLNGEVLALHRQGRFREAVTLARQILEIRRQSPGEKHPDYAQSLNNLALLYQFLDDYAKAEPLYQKALEVRKQSLGEKHPNYALSVSNLAGLYEHMGDYVKAEPLCQKALAIRKEVLGEKHSDYATSLNNLAGLYEKMGDYTKAEPLYQKVLDIKKQTLGEIHPDYAATLNNLAGLYKYMGDYTKAEPLYWKALDIRKEILGEKHPDYATSLDNLAGLCEHMGHYNKAEPLYRKALEIRQRALGEKHSDYATSLNNLAGLYEHRGDYAKAESLYQKALDTKKQTLGEMHPDYATGLDNLAGLYQDMGDYAKAEPLYQKALEIRKEVLGEKHPPYATSLNNLALLYQAMGDYNKAEPLLQKALEIHKQALGEKHPHYATSLDNLAGLYQVMSDYAKAEPLYQKALEIKKQALGEKHPDYATSLNNLALLYTKMGDYAKGEPLYRKALEIRKQSLAEMHPDYADSLNNLAVLYYSLGDYAKAEPLFHKARDIRKQVLGEKHPDYATSLNNLAGLCEKMGNYAKAESLYQKALDIKKQTLGEMHPDYATSLNGLAGLYYAKRDYAKGEPLYRKALEIRKQSLAEKHPDYAASLSNLATVYYSQGDYAKAEPLYQKALAIARDNLELAAAAQSQRQQLTMLEDLRFGLDAYLSLAAEAKQPAQRLYEPALTWKGAVSLRQRHQRLARRHPELADDFINLDRVASHLATIALTVPDPKQQEARRHQIQKLTEEKELLESKLARRSAEFRKEKELQRLTPTQLQAVLPKEAALLDFLEYTHFTPSAVKKGQLHRERRLVAFVVRRDSLTRVDLGPVQPIKEAIDRWHLALQRRFRTKDDDALGDAVRRLVWQKLEEHLRGAKVVLVSSDGALSRIPFAALPGGKKGSYLLEEAAIAVVPVPHLLPELLTPRRDAGKKEPSLLLVGDVNYSADAAGAVIADSRTAPRAGTLWSWKALENTRDEVATVKDSFQRRFRRAVVTDLREDEPTEAAVRQQAPKHRYLHLATHGFFAPPEVRSALSAASRGKDGEVGNLFGGRKDVAGFHPGLLSGLVLAGANRPAEPGKDDGILTALEVEGLDLTGVELATLSACETGLGEQAGGEGLLGLQRAFQVAGARSVVAGLWQVDDAATRRLMVTFYDNLWRKKLPKLEALRQAQLWMLKEGNTWMQKEGIARAMIDPRVPREKPVKDDGRLPPYYWAAFALSGDWR